MIDRVSLINFGGRITRVELIELTMGLSPTGGMFPDTRGLFCVDGPGVLTVSAAANREEKLVPRFTVVVRVGIKEFPG